MKQTTDEILISEIATSLELALMPTLSAKELHDKIAGHLSWLIEHDFEKLVFLLYRIDVDEMKMRNLLDQNKGEDAANLLADLIIERQLQKIRSRQAFKQRDDSIDENEKW